MVLAVLDLGFEGYEELQERGELPKNMTTRCFRTYGDITGGGEIHGSACAEVIVEGNKKKNVPI